MPNDAETPPNVAIRLTALSLADAAKVLSRSGGRPVTEAMLRADVAEGAPANADGTVNLIHYAAWLVKELAHGD
jgi:hypothetical protein